MTQFPEGAGGARYYGFYVDLPSGVPLETITIHADDGWADFAIGEFGIAVPEPTSWAVVAVGALAFLPRCHHR